MFISLTCSNLNWLPVQGDIAIKDVNNGNIRKLRLCSVTTNINGYVQRMGEGRLKKAVCEDGGGEEGVSARSSTFLWLLSALTVEFGNTMAVAFSERVPC